MFKPISIPKELNAEGISARAITRKMGSELFAAIDESRLRLREYLYWVDYVTSEEDELNAINDFIAGRENGSQFVYALFDTANRLVGTIDIHEISYGNNSAVIGYWLRNGATGKGYVSKILRLLEQAFFQAGMHRLVIECVVENTASAKVAERNGYRFEGIAFDKIYGYEKYWDAKVYSKLNPL